MLAERDRLNLRSDEGEAEEDARRRRCMRVGSTFGILAATANKERTTKGVEQCRSHRWKKNTPSTIDTIPDSGSEMFPSPGEFGLSSVTKSRCALAMENEYRDGMSNTGLAR